MLSPDDALNRLDHLVRCARQKGADAADAVYSASNALSVDVRLGALEGVERVESEEIGLRLFIGQHAAIVSTSDLSPANLEDSVDRALLMARETSPDPYAGLADAALLAHAPFPDLDLFDPTCDSPEELRARALCAEDAALAVDKVTNSLGASAAQTQAIYALCTSHGFAGGYRRSSHSLSASVIAGEGETMQRDYAWRSARYKDDLEPPAALGQRAGQRAAERLAPIKLKSAAMPVIFDPRVSASLLDHLIDAIRGNAITRGASFLLDRRDQPVFAPGIQIIDDPLRPRGLASRPFDGEGLPSVQRALVDDGILQGWLLDSASARQLGETPTGHAARGVHGTPGTRASNLHMAAGPVTPAALIADIDRGFYVTELIGHGVNDVTGDYSRGAAGFLIEKGQRTVPVAEVTIAGNLRDMFAALIPASDLHFHHAVNAPTLRIEGMTVAGD